jgi:hypothetical protein
MKRLAAASLRAQLISGPEAFMKMSSSGVSTTANRVLNVVVSSGSRGSSTVPGMATYQSRIY